jgi:hypothetical protein
VNLSPEDVALFYKLMWAAQHYVNHRLGLVAGVKTVEAYANSPQDGKIKVRDALYQHIELLDDFASQNPAHLTPDELRIVQSWRRHHLAGEFYVFRYLKRHAIFIASKTPLVYAVLGLNDPIEAVLGWRPTPVYVQAVLLPFKGVIIYDGLLAPYNIYFGAGIRGDLNELYQRAKQNGAILESLGHAAPRKSKPKKPARNWGPALDDLVASAEQLRQANHIFQTRAFTLLKASARLAQAAAHDPDNLDELFQLGRSVSRALKQLETALDRSTPRD